MNYEQGLELLQQLIKRHEISKKEELDYWTLVHRLHENLDYERGIGMNETISSARARIVRELNSFALRRFSISFTHLCRMDLSRPVPTVVKFFSNVQILEDLIRDQPKDAELLSTLGRHYFFLGEIQAAREHFHMAWQLEKGQDPRGIIRGWIMLASLAVGDVAMAKQILDDVRAKDEYDYKSGKYYLEIYDSWCSALTGAKDPWRSLINQCLSGMVPSDMYVSPITITYPYVYFELAAGLAATDYLQQAWRAIDLGEIDLLGALYMCGLASLPVFCRLHVDERYGAKLENWFDERARRFMLPRLRELRKIVEEWRLTRARGSQVG